MLTKFFFLIFLLSCVSNHNEAQVSFRIEAGFGYIEHFSTGAGIVFSDKHALTVLYGSNFFIRLGDFQNLFVQYDLKISRFQILGMNPGFGIKSGYSVFSDESYRWKLIHAIPFFRLHYGIHGNACLFADIGLATSAELSVERLRFGEVGMYRRYLPEYKLGISLRL